MFIRHPPPLTGNRPLAFTKRTTHAPHRSAARFLRGPAQRAQRKLLSDAVSGPCSAIFFASRLASVLISGGGWVVGGGGLYASVRRRKAQDASLNERASAAAAVGVACLCCRRFPLVRRERGGPAAAAPRTGNGGKRERDALPLASRCGRRRWRVARSAARPRTGAAWVIFFFTPRGQSGRFGGCSDKRPFALSGPR